VSDSLLLLRLITENDYCSSRDLRVSSFGFFRESHSTPQLCPDNRHWFWRWERLAFMSSHEHRSQNPRRGEPQAGTAVPHRLSTNY